MNHGGFPTALSGVMRHLIIFVFYVFLLSSCSQNEDSPFIIEKQHPFE